MSCWMRDHVIHSDLSSGNDAKKRPVKMRPKERARQSFFRVARNARALSLYWRSQRKVPQKAWYPKVAKKEGKKGQLFRSYIWSS